MHNIFTALYPPLIKNDQNSSNIYNKIIFASSLYTQSNPEKLSSSLYTQLIFMNWLWHETTYIPHIMTWVCSWLQIGTDPKLWFLWAKLINKREYDGRKLHLKSQERKKKRILNAFLHRDAFVCEKLMLNVVRRPFWPYINNKIIFLSPPSWTHGYFRMPKCIHRT